MTTNTTETYDQQRAREIAERDTLAIRGAADVSAALTKATGDAWGGKPYLASYSSSFTLERYKDGMRIHASLNHKKTHWDVCSGWVKIFDKRIGLQDCKQNGETACASMAASKSAEAIAKDITRRVLPTCEVWMERTIKAAGIERNRNEWLSKAGARICDETNHNMDTCGYVAQGELPKRFHNKADDGDARIEVELCSYHSRATLKIEDVTVDTAIAIMRMLKP